MSSADETPTPAQDGDLDVASALSLLGAAMDTLVLRALADAGLHGLRPGHGYVIQRLLQGPATATEMAAALGVSQQAVSKSVRELADLGYVRFAADPADRRRRPLELSPSGARAVAVSRQARAAFALRLEGAVGRQRMAVATGVLAAALEVTGRADAVRRRAVPPPDAVS